MYFVKKYEESCEIEKKYENQLLQKEEKNQLLKQLYEEKIITEKEKYDFMLQEIYITEKERNQLFYQEKIQSYENEITTLVEKNTESYVKLISMEKKLCMEEEYKKHIQTISDLRIENELIIRMKNLVENQNLELTNYKNLLVVSEKTIMQMEHHMKFQENTHIQKLQQELLESIDLLFVSMVLRKRLF